MTGNVLTIDDKKYLKVAETDWRTQEGHIVNYKFVCKAREDMKLNLGGSVLLNLQALVTMHPKPNGTQEVVTKEAEKQEPAQDQKNEPQQN